MRPLAASRLGWRQGGAVSLEKKYRWMRLLVKGYRENILKWGKYFL